MAKVSSFIVYTSIFVFSLVSWVGLGMILPLNSSSSAAELNEIQERGYLMVAVKDNMRPLAFRDESGNLQGLEIDLARHLAEELLGRADAVRFQPVANRDRLKVVLERKVDMAIARMTATASRSRLVDFTAPYYLDGTSIVTKDRSVEKDKDLSGKKVAILNGSSTIATVRYVLPKVRLVGVNSYEEGRSLVESGGAIGFAADNSVLAGWVQEYPQYRMVPVWLSGEALCVVMAKGLQNNKLWDRVNAALARWKAEGWLQERAKYWGLP